MQVFPLVEFLDKKFRFGTVWWSMVHTRQNGYRSISAFKKGDLEIRFQASTGQASNFLGI